jgi:hypothetical protein
MSGWRAISVLLAGLAAAAPGGAVELRPVAAAVQLDVAALLNARVVTTLASGRLVPWSTGLDGEWSGLATRAAADAMGSRARVALPGDGEFPADRFHPRLQLHFADAEAVAPQARYVGRGVADRCVIPAGDGCFSRVVLVCTSAFGATAIEVTLVYADGGERRARALVPDWGETIADTPERFAVARDLAKWSRDNRELEPDHHALTGVAFAAEPSRRLRVIRVAKPASDTALVFWGAAGEPAFAP